MRIKYIENKHSFLMSELSMNVSSYRENFIFPLQQDKEYVVYAKTIHDGCVWYYICDKAFIDYPVWIPCLFLK